MGDHNRNKKLPRPAALVPDPSGTLVLDAGNTGRSKGCASKIVVEVDFLPLAEFKIGTKVTTPRGNPTQLEAAGSIIGHVESRLDPYLSGCVAEGFRFEGRVSSIARDSLSGTVELRGVRARS